MQIILEDKRLIKGTRMIVITKDNILKTVLTIGVVVFSIILCFLIANKNNTNAYSEFEKIIDNEIVPAREKSVKKKQKDSFPVKLLKNYFGLGNIKEVKNDTIKHENITNENKEPEISSESVTITRGITVSNNTNYSINPNDFINQVLSFKINNSGPQVLIMHTHTTECYSEATYVKGAPDRNLDENKNITAVGVAIEKVLKENGINVIHDKTVHDYPSYNSAYQSAEATIRKNLNQYKSIKVVLDIHRDGITRNDGTKVKLVTDINGEKTAQIMLVCGTDTNLQHDKWRENFKFASKIQAKAEEKYPSLMRPIDLRKERFNEQLTTGSIIIEVGSNGNTMEEAIRGGEKIAEIISLVLKEG